MTFASLGVLYPYLSGIIIPLGVGYCIIIPYKVISTTSDLIMCN